jgi:hypothetical protein
VSNEDYRIVQLIDQLDDSIDMIPEGDFGAVRVG